MKSCTLNGTMTCPASVHSLEIGADNITIDGDGYAIDGSSPDSAAWSGVYCFGPEVGTV